MFAQRIGVSMGHTGMGWQTLFCMASTMRRLTTRPSPPIAGTKRLNGYWWGQEPQPPVLQRLGSKIEQLWYRLHSTGVDTQVPR